MQWLGKNGLSRVERIGYRRQQRLRRILSNGRPGRAHGREQRRKVPGRVIPGNFRPGRRGNRARRVNIPDGGRKDDEKRLQADCSRESELREILVDPAFSKVSVRGKFLRRRGPAKERAQAGEELLERSRPPQGKPGNGQVRRGVERNGYVRLYMQVSDFKQTGWPPWNYTPVGRYPHQMRFGGKRSPSRIVARPNICGLPKRRAGGPAAIDPRGKLPFIGLWAKSCPTNGLPFTT